MSKIIKPTKEEIIKYGDFVCIVDDPKFVGKMPVRTDIEVLPADEPKQQKIGWVVHETIGVAAYNPKAISGFKFVTDWKEDFSDAIKNYKEEDKD